MLKKYATALLLIFGPLPVFSADYGTPVTNCLNDQTIPYISSDKPATDIVNDAYKKCADEIQQWDIERESLPAEMVKKQDTELHDFYVRMIDKRRKVEREKK
ncbi:hypothetical protein [Pluralibacter gergoviae]|uniref:hypothetical protein n=1 Tax=Pluralibacter gergoviae TaxID=61647 RepID=UPI00093BC36E|nr:hypothetical protein [Pluralibacter gergoviae]